VNLDPVKHELAEDRAWAARLAHLPSKKMRVYLHSKPPEYRRAVIRIYERGNLIRRAQLINFFESGGPARLAEIKRGLRENTE